MGEPDPLCCKDCSLITVLLSWLPTIVAVTHHPPPALFPASAFLAHTGQRWASLPLNNSGPRCSFDAGDAPPGPGESPEPCWAALSWHHHQSAAGGEGSRPKTHHLDPFIPNIFHQLQFIPNMYPTTPRGRSVSPVYELLMLSDGGRISYLALIVSAAVVRGES